MLSYDEQTSTVFYWMLRLRKCPTCGQPWTLHKDGAADQNEAWDHIGDLIAKKVVEQLEARKAQG